MVALPFPNRTVARIDYDEDEDEIDGDGRPDWRRRLLTWTLAAIGLGLGFLIPYTLYLNSQVSERFGQLRWQVPTRVYARPLMLAPGVAMDARSEEHTSELQSLMRSSYAVFCLKKKHTPSH